MPSCQPVSSPLGDVFLCDSPLERPLTEVAVGFSSRCACVHESRAGGDTTNNSGLSEEASGERVQLHVDQPGLLQHGVGVTAWL